MDKILDKLERAARAHINKKIDSKVLSMNFYFPSYSLTL